MPSLRRAAHDILAATHQPDAVAVRQCRAYPPRAPSILTLAAPNTLDALVHAALAGATTALVLPNDRSAPRSVSASFVRAVIRAAARRVTVEVGSRRHADAWEPVAATLGARAVALGDTGWTRVELTDHGLLDTVYLPAEVMRAPRVLALPDPHGARAFGFWSDVVHPHSALRARVSGHRALVDLAVAVPAAWAFTLHTGASHAPLIAWTDDPIAAELAMLAATYLKNDANGYEQIGPWEDERIQAAVERGLGAVAGHELLLRVRDDDREAVAFVERVARLLDCAVEIMPGG